MAQLDLTPTQVAEITLAILKGDTTIREVCESRDVSPAVVAAWMAECTSGFDSRLAIYEKLRWIKRRIKTHVLGRSTVLNLRFNDDDRLVGDKSGYWFSSIPLPAGELVLNYSKDCRLAEVDIVYSHLCPPESQFADMVEDGTMELEMILDFKLKSAGVKISAPADSRLKHERIYVVSRPLPAPMCGGVKAKYGEETHWLRSIAIERADLCMPPHYFQY